MKPLLHFLLLGGLLFGAKPLLPAPEPARAPVRIAAAEIAALRAQWPDQKQFEAALERHVRDEVLLSEALRLGLDEHDAVARQRMLANMRFAFPQPVRGDAMLMREARALGMQRRDVVVRRRLVQLMEQRLAAGAGPTAAELAQHVAQYQERQASAARLTFQQVFFGPDQTSAASTALAQLRAGGTVAGEPFLLGRVFTGLTARQVADRLGAEFAAAVQAAPAGEWTGPHASPFGLHLVRVEAQAAATSESQALRSPLAYALQHEQRQRRTREETAKLRASYRVELP